MKPLIVINLWTLSYHFKIRPKDLICGYQLNRIKFNLEKFLQKISDAGAEMVFVFKKGDCEDPDYLKRRSDDYHDACKMLKNIQTIQKFDQLEKVCTSRNEVPYNVLILTSMIQSAKKFGKVYGNFLTNCKPSVLQAELANELNAAYMMGLDTYMFFLPGNWKIWSDEGLIMETMEIREFDKEVVLKHFNLTYEKMPLLAAFTGDLQSNPYVIRKVCDYFGTRTKFPIAAKFIENFEFPLSDVTLTEIAIKIFGANYKPDIVDDFKKTLAQFDKSSIVKSKVDPEIIEHIKNDFMSYAEEIITNDKPIFVTPVFLNLKSKDMLNMNELVLPWIQKTVGILLKNSCDDDKEPRSVVMLDNSVGKFTKNPIDPIYPDFEVPSLKPLISGEISTYEKMKILYWLLDIKLNDIEESAFPEKFLVDCLILLYLIKKNSLTILDARCILKTLVDSRRKVVPLEYETDYPQKINSRALRCTFLYSKLYFILHSCLACLGMKNFCPEIQVGTKEII